MASNDFWVFTIENVSVQDEDELSSWLFDLGASGVQENLEFQQTDIKYLPELQESEIKTLYAYFESRPEESLSDIVCARYPQIKINISQQKAKDWLSEWKESWQPFVLTDSYWVVPTWLSHEFHREGCEKILIDPGMAFGTGTHATTQMASRLIQEATRGQNFAQAMDVGTGSGILSILLNKLGVESITAYDNDPEAKRVFLENIALNSCPQCHWREDWDETTGYDLLIANIIDGILLDLKASFKKSLRPGGSIIFSGILKEREDGFLQEMREGWNLQIVRRLEQDEWLGFLMKAQP